MKKKLTVKQKSIKKAQAIQKRKQQIKKSVVIQIVNRYRKPIVPDGSGILIMGEQFYQKRNFARIISNSMNRKFSASKILSLISADQLDSINGFAMAQDFINNHCMNVNVSFNYNLNTDFSYLGDYINSNNEIHKLKFIEY